MRRGREEFVRETYGGGSCGDEEYGLLEVGLGGG